MSDNVELNQIKQAVKDLKDRVDEQAQVMSKKAKEAAQNAVHCSQEKVGQLKTAIEEKPLQAVGIAALAGLVLGFLFKKSR